MNNITLEAILNLIEDNSGDIFVLDDEENLLGQYDGKNSISSVLSDHVVSGISILPERKVNIYINRKTI